jgi:hypothetical protein
MLIPLRKKYRDNTPCKGVKNQKGGNGKREGGKNRINWKKGSGLGDKAVAHK